MVHSESRVESSEDAKLRSLAIAGEILDERRKVPPEVVEDPAPTATAASQTVARIIGQVVDQFGHAVPWGVAELHGSAGAHSTAADSVAVDPDGNFEFRPRRPGRYQVHLRQGSLPRGYLIPWRQSQGARVYKDDANFANGFFATEVEIPLEGGEFVLELRVFQAAVVAGYVFAPSGEPVEGAIVRIQSSLVAAPTGLEATTTTDPSGRYELFEVYPSTYRTEVWLEEARIAEYRSMARPLPARIEVVEGGIYEVPPLRVGVGSGRVTGRVVNQDGAPFSNLTVMGYLALPVEPDEIPFN